MRTASFGNGLAVLPALFQVPVTGLPLVVLLGKCFTVSSWKKTVGMDASS